MTNQLELLREALRGRYDPVREVGRGGMATVYLAQDVKHNRRVAVKVLRPELAASIAVSRFLKEIEIAAQLNHPHIVPLLDSGDVNGVLPFVMPFVKGSSSGRRCARLDIRVTGRLLERNTARVCCQPRVEGL